LAQPRRLRRATFDELCARPLRQLRIDER